MIEYTVNKKIILNKEDEEALLFNPDTGEISILNYQAVHIYECLCQNKTLEAIRIELCSIFEQIPADVIKEDMDHFVQDLVTKNVLSIKGAS